MAKSRKRSETASNSSLGTTDQGSNGEGPSGDPRDRIALRAYELYLARGGRDGGDFDDWLDAERELTASTPDSKSDRSE
jgi:Protein of unknown function (DUF2934)